MNEYTCIIVDDEPLARQLLISHVEKIPYLQVLAICNNAIEAKIELTRNKPQILFIDIQMPNLNGNELLKMLENKPATVLTTAYSDYAVESYDLDVVDYLLKPIVFERFFKAVQKCIDRLEFSKKQSFNTVENIEEFIVVKADYKSIKVLFQDILFIEALQKYIRIYTTSQRIITLVGLSQFESNLPQHFLRIHRSYIVNTHKIEIVEGNFAFIGKSKIPISKSKKAELLKFFNKSNL